MISPYAVPPTRKHASSACPAGNCQCLADNETGCLMLITNRPSEWCRFTGPARSHIGPCWIRAGRDPRSAATRDHDQPWHGVPPGRASPSFPLPVVSAPRRVRSPSRPLPVASAPRRVPSPPPPRPYLPSGPGRPAWSVAFVRRAGEVFVGRQEKYAAVALMRAMLSGYGSPTWRPHNLSAPAPAADAAVPWR